MLPRSSPQNSLSAGRSLYRLEKTPHYPLDACCIAVRRFHRHPLLARCVFVRRLLGCRLPMVDCRSSSERWSYMPLLFLNIHSVAATLLEATGTLESFSFSRTLEKVPVVRPFNSQALAQRQVWRQRLFRLHITRRRYFPLQYKMDLEDRMRVLCGFLWFRTGKTGGFLWKCWWNFGFHKCVEFLI
jgi:hypothetical protein